MHPFVTVLSGLDQERRDLVVDQIRHLAAGNFRGIRGLLQQGARLVEPAEGILGQNLAGGLDLVLDVDRPPTASGAIPAEVARLDQLSKEADVLAVTAVVVRHELDPHAVYEAARLQRELERIEANSSDAPRTEKVRQLLAEVDSVSPALEQMAEGVTPVIKLWRDYLSIRDQHQDRIYRLQSVVTESRQRVAAAEAAHAAATEQARPLLLSPKDDARLNELMLDERTSRLFGFGHKGLSESEQAEIDELLRRCEQPSYTAYVMHRIDPQPSPEASAALRAAQHELESARYDLADAEAELELDPAVVAVAEHEQRARAAAAELLGPALPPDLEPALAGLVEEVPNPTWLEKVGQLRAAAVDVGMISDDELAAEMVPVLVADRLNDVSSWDETATIRQLDAALGVYRARSEAHLRAHARLLETENIAREVERERSALLNSIEDRSEIAGSGVAGHGLPGGSRGIRNRVDRLAKQLVANAGESVPLVVTGDFRDLSDRALGEFLDWAALISESVQIIVITDRLEAQRWVERTGLEEAVAIGPGVVS